MRQFEWDKSIEELCSSQEEIQELKEIASLLQGIPPARASYSFQTELKARLMEKALTGEKRVSRGNKLLYLINKSYRYGGAILKAHPLLATAAAVLLVVSLTVFSNRGLVTPVPPGIVSPEKPPEIIVAENPNPKDIKPEENTLPVEPGAEVRTPEEGSSDDPGAGEILPETVTTPADNPPPAVEKPSEPPVVTEKPIGEEPEFEALKNLQSYRLAGAVNLPSVYYKAERDAAVPAENVHCSWKPRKIVASTDPDGAGIFGTEAWVAEDLSNKGFIVREGDYLRINLQETPKDSFAEVFYRPRKGIDNVLTLVLHYQEGAGAGTLSYYYREEGEAGQPGFYPILSPSEAFKQVADLQWYAPLQLLDFSFQEVALTYYDFLLEEDGGPRYVKLPAYRFLGREILSDGGELIIYLPAIR